LLTRALLTIGLAAASPATAAVVPLLDIATTLTRAQMDVYAAYAVGAPVRLAIDLDLAAAAVPKPNGVFHHRAAHVRLDIDGDRFTATGAVALVGRPGYANHMQLLFGRPYGLDAITGPKRKRFAPSLLSIVFATSSLRTLDEAHAVGDSLRLSKLLFMTRSPNGYRSVAYGLVPAPASGLLLAAALVIGAALGRGRRDSRAT
jgi:hypothetical protein